MNSSEICHVGSTSFHHELGSTQFPLESRRYWLFTSKLCPFAHRTEIVRSLKNLDKEVGLTIAGSVQTKAGWNLVERYEGTGSSPSPVDSIGRLPGIYQLASPGYEGRVSVPVLFDTKVNQIVNNESSQIVRQLDRNFSETGPVLYPMDKEREIDGVTEFIETSLVTPIYRAGFAQNQETYETNFESVFDALDNLEAMLNDDVPFLVGDELTLADVHAFAHLSRFDAVYHSLYKLNRHYLAEYPYLSAYVKRLSQIPAFGDTFDLQEIKRGYFLSWNQPTPGTFVPMGPTVDSRSGVAVLDPNQI